MVLPTPLELALLGLLLEEPRSGYDLRKLFATTPLGRYTDSPGAIYPALGRLRRRRLVRSARRRPRSLRPREVFAATRSGRHAFLRWLASVPTRDDVVWNEDAEMLKFAYLGVFCRPGRARTFLRSYLAGVTEYSRELRSYLRARGRGFPATGRMAIQLAIQVLDARTRWAKRALRWARRRR
jgi:DNA-binding PadR family transcriptional regulator